MQITTRLEQETLIVRVGGRLDAVGAPEFEKQCAALVDAGSRRLVVNLAEVDYVSSSGLRAFLSLSKRLQPLGGKLVLCALSAKVKEILDLAGFGQLATVCPDEAAAIRQM